MRAAVSFAALSISGCGVVDGWRDFADSMTAGDHHGFQPSAHQVAAGDFDHLRLLVTSNAGSLVVARHHGAGSTTIALRSLDLTFGCDVPGTDFVLSERSDGISSEVVVLDDPDGDGRGTLTFVDGHCAPLMDPLRDAMLPDAYYFEDQFLLRADSRLLVVEPHQNRTTELASKLESIEQRLAVVFPESAIAYPTWFADNGTFRALRMDSGVVEYSYGTSVSEIVPNTSMGRSVPSEYFVVDNGDLAWVSSAGARVIAPDACGVHLVDDDHVAYHHPCTNGVLTVYEVSTGASAPIDALGDKLLAFDGNELQPSALYTCPPNDTGPGLDICIRLLGGTASRIANHAVWTGSQFTYFPAAFYRDSSEQLHFDFTAVVESTDGRSGRLVYLNQSVPLLSNDAGASQAFDIRTLAERVPVIESFSPYDPQLANFDGNVADFVDPFNAPGQVIASGVPPRSDAYASRGKYQLLLANFTDGAGTLGILPSHDVSSSYVGVGPRPITWLADHVAPGQFEYFPDMFAISYIDRWNATRGNGRLVSHDLDYLSDVYLAEHVREKLEISRPWIGVVYAIAEGDAQGIWARHAN